MSEYEEGYKLGNKMEKEECNNVVMEWKKLEKQVLPLWGKPDPTMIKEERTLLLDYDLFWMHKALQKTELLIVSHELTSGFKKAVLEKECV